eukprot:SAG31_NODE_2480_length_5634_cov_5.818248_3_plen_71_part_00
MKYLYKANVNGVDVKERGVKPFVKSINAAIGVPVLTTNMVYNYFSKSRPERTSHMVQSLNMQREQLFYVV